MGTTGLVAVATVAICAAALQNAVLMCFSNLIVARVFSPPHVIAVSASGWSRTSWLASMCVIASYVSSEENQHLVFCCVAVLIEERLKCIESVQKAIWMCVAGA